MSEFHAEIAEKKKLTSGSRHKKNGVKSKKCTLPSDHLTPAQIKKLSGEVYTLQLNKPMRFEEFKALPVSLQQEYISHLQKTFDVGLTALATMLHVSPAKFKMHCKTYGIEYETRGGKASEVKRFAWREFQGLKAEEPAEPEEVAAEEPVEPENRAEEPVKVESYWPVLPDSLTLDITGDPVLLAEYIKALPLQGKYRMRVRLERVVEERE